MKIHSSNSSRILVATGLCLFTGLLFAGGESGAKPLSLFMMITSLLGGLGMFLYGMEMMSDGMKLSAGNSMRNILAKLTSNRFIAVIVGALVTMVIQSSSATTVMLVSFVNSGLLSFTQAFGVVMGANVGTTITAQIVAFKISDYALLLIAVGAIMLIASKKDSLKNMGMIILGFGLLFYGMDIMSKTMAPLKHSPSFMNILTRLENPLLGILGGLVFTALIQSSSATTGIVITLAMSGSMTLEAGIPLIFGSNIGTCLTALLAAMNSTRDAKRVAFGHITFNVIGVLLFFFFIPQFTAYITTTAENVPRQIANAHTIFNVVVTLAFLPFTGMVSRAIIRFFPDKAVERDISKPEVLHLNEQLVNQPEVALNNVQAEIRGVVGLLERVVGSLVRPFIDGKDAVDIENAKLDVVTGMKQRIPKITYINSQISAYLMKVSRNELTLAQSREAFALFSVINDLDAINKTVESRLDELITRKEELKEHFSPAGQEEIVTFHTKLIKQLHRLSQFFTKFERQTAEKIVAKGKKYKDLEEKYSLEHFKRVSGNVTESVATHQLHVELMDMLKQINVQIEQMATVLLQIDSDQTSASA